MFGGWVDRVLQVVSVVGFAVPAFWLAMLLASAFAINLGWFPATGYTAPATSIPEWIRSITLPAFSLALAAIAATAPQLRSSLIEVMQEDFVLTLRSRVIPEREIIFKHALRCRPSRGAVETRASSAATCCPPSARP